MVTRTVRGRDVVGIGEHIYAYYSFFMIASVSCPRPRGRYRAAGPPTETCLLHGRLASVEGSGEILLDISLRLAPRAEYRGA